MAFKNFFKFGKKKEDEVEKEEIEKVEKSLENIVVESNVENFTEKEEEKIEIEKVENKPKPLKDRLAAPKKGFFGKLKELLLGKAIDDELYEELEELLIQSDI